MDQPHASIASLPGPNSHALTPPVRLSCTGRNPFEGYTPKVPHGERLDFASDEYLALEEAGAKEAGRAAFLLVAGGLGERLGYSGEDRIGFRPL